MVRLIVTQAVHSDSYKGLLSSLQIKIEERVILFFASKTKFFSALTSHDFLHLFHLIEAHNVPPNIFLIDYGWEVSRKFFQIAEVSRWLGVAETIGGIQVGWVPLSLGKWEDERKGMIVLCFWDNVFLDFYHGGLFGYLIDIHDLKVYFISGLYATYV